MTKIEQIEHFQTPSLSLSLPLSLLLSLLLSLFSFFLSLPLSQWKQTTLSSCITEQNLCLWIPLSNEQKCHSCIQTLLPCEEWYLSCITEHCRCFWTLPSIYTNQVQWTSLSPSTRRITWSVQQVSLDLLVSLASVGEGKTFNTQLFDSQQQQPVASDSTMVRVIMVAVLFALVFSHVTGRLEWEGLWGDWGPVQYCPGGSYAIKVCILKTFLTAKGIWAELTCVQNTHTHTHTHTHSNCSGVVALQHFSCQFSWEWIQIDCVTEMCTDAFAWSI